MSFTIRCFAILLASAALVSAADFRDGQAAWAVVGQPFFGAQSAPPSQSVTGTAGGLAFANGKLFVAEGNRLGATTTGPGGVATTGNRVLMFNTNAFPDPRSTVDSTGNTGNQRCPLCGFPAANVLGQANFTDTTQGLQSGSITGMRNPNGVATDGTTVAVADSDNNRILIWKSIPSSPGQQADLVLGQPNLSTVQASPGVHNNTLRGPEGVWIQNGKLFVADTQNHRVLIWNSIPSSNGQAADVVLGQADFNSAVAPDPGATVLVAAANRLLNPTSVTADGTRLFVSDLGFNRVLVWNSIPSANDQPADVVIGQPDMVSAVPNNNSALCPVSSTDSSGTKHYPSRCAGTLDFPRYALTDPVGGRLFIADGGNDRVLVYNTIPTTNGAAANTVLGQPDMFADVVSDPTVLFATTTVPNVASTNTVRTPTSLAWDGTNLYVAEPYELRVMIFTPGDNTSLAPNSIFNAASKAIFQEGTVALAGTITAGDIVTVTINDTTVGSGPKAYNYTVQKGDTLDTIAQGLVNAVNANGGDPTVLALVGNPTSTVFLSSRHSDLGANSVSLSAAVALTGSTGTSAPLTATTSGSYLSGGNASTIAPGTIVTINGTDLTNGTTASAPDAPLSSDYNSQSATPLPHTLAGSTVYLDGRSMPMLYASPTQINVQVPYYIAGTNSASIFVRTITNAGGIQITNAAPIIVAPANPGIFAASGTDPRPAIAMHASTFASSVVSVDGSVKADDVGTITIAGKAYTYKVVTGDSLASIAQGLVKAINNGNDPNVTASLGGQFARVVLTAKTQGSGGNGISVAASVSSGAGLILTAYTGSTCCAANQANALVTTSNPAVPGETIILEATGLGALSGDAGAQAVEGTPYAGPQPNSVTSSVSATVGGVTSQVVSAGLPPQGTGVYQVSIIIPTNAVANSTSQVYLAQDAYVSNIASLPIGGSGNNLVSFSASPRLITVPASGDPGTTTLSWNATGIQQVEVHVNSSDGPLLGSGGASGSVTTGNWVSNGMIFYLQDVSNGKALTADNTLATVQTYVDTAQHLTKFISNPDPIQVVAGQTYASTTLSWLGPDSVTATEVHIGSPSGPMFAQGGQSGSAQSGQWVSNGLTFYLQDVTGGKPLTPANTLATYTATLQVIPEQGTLLATPNSVQSSNGQLFGSATLTWNTTTATLTQIHVGAPNGPEFTQGGATGSATTDNWVTDGMVFYLQDVSFGQPLTYASTIATQTVHLSATSQTSAPYIQLSPNPILINPGDLFGSATVSWNAPSSTGIEIHVNSPTGPELATGAAQGSATASGWVSEGTVFYLIDGSTRQTLAQVTAHLQSNQP